jgi:FMN phosphatase YigB (HAD superfamily)
MVAAHIWDLRAAAKVGMTTIYIPRPSEDAGVKDDVKPKSEGGEVDYVVKSFEGIVSLVRGE